MIRRALAAALLALAVPIPAVAQGMPDYDPEAHCRQVATAGGGFSQTMMNLCLQGEQRSYDGLKDRWAALPEAMRGHCDRVARVGGAGSFNMLALCVQGEERAAQQNQQFQFRR